jgi:SAM-dependent methyltransferase
MSKETHSSLRPYREAVDREGATFGALLWHSPAYQQRRFEVFAEGADLTGRVVADIGCGRADFLVYLNEAGVQYGGFVGVDGLAEMVAYAQSLAEREHLEETAFVQADFASDATLFSRLVKDHGAEVFAFSGSLNTFAQEDAYVVLDRAWAALVGAQPSGPSAGNVLMFNFLSDSGHKPGEDLGPAKRFRTSEMVQWALDRTPRITLRTDYLPSHDATIVMFSA